MTRRDAIGTRSRPTGAGKCCRKCPAGCPHGLWWLSAGSSFAVITLWRRMQQVAQPITMVTRFRLDAALHEPAPPRQPGQKGRQRLKGKRLPTLDQMVHDPKTTWASVTLRNCYGGMRRVVEIVSGAPVWYQAGMPPLPIRWVVMIRVKKRSGDWKSPAETGESRLKAARRTRFIGFSSCQPVHFNHRPCRHPFLQWPLVIPDPQGAYKPQALLCTDLTADPVQIVTWFVMRWQLEVTFHEVRAHLGVETQWQWSDLAIARTTPALLGLFSLATLAANCLTTEGTLPAPRLVGVVHEVPADVCRCVGRRPTGLVAAYDFSDIIRADRHRKTAQSLLERCTEALCYAY